MNNTMIKIAAILTALSISSVALAQDKVVATSNLIPGTRKADVSLVVGHLDVCSRIDANTIECVRLKKGEKTLVFRIKG